MKLSILLHGLELHRNELTPMMDKLQDQLDKIDKYDIEVLYCIDNGETSIEEKKQWLLEQSDSKRYVFIDKDSEIKDNFILLRYNAIKQHWPTDKQVELGIFHKN